MWKKRLFSNLFLRVEISVRHELQCCFCCFTFLFLLICKKNPVEILKWSNLNFFLRFMLFLVYWLPLLAKVKKKKRRNEKKIKKEKENVFFKNLLRRNRKAWNKNSTLDNFPHSKSTIYIKLFFCFFWPGPLKLFRFRTTLTVFTVYKYHLNRTFNYIP